MNKTIMMLIKIALGIFINNNLEKKDVDFVDRVKACIPNLKTPPGLADLNLEGDLVENIKDTIDALLNVEGEFTEKQLLQRLKFDFCGNDEYLVLVEVILKDLTTEEEKQAFLRDVAFSVISFVNKENLVLAFREANKKLSSQDEHLDVYEFLEEHVKYVEETKLNFGGNREVDDFAITSEDVDSIQQALEEFIETSTSGSTIKTPYKGLNAMLGNGGLAVPSYLNITALTGNYKSGLLLDLFIGALMFNKPHNVKEGCKPLILRISLEETLPKDMARIYKRVKQWETGERVDLRKVNRKEASDYISEKLKANGWEYRMMYFQPGKYGPEDVYRTIEGLESKGYDIKMLNLDYMHLLLKTKDKHNETNLILDMAEKLRGFCFAHGIQFSSAHQFNSTAKGNKPEEGPLFAGLALASGEFKMCKTLDEKMEYCVGIDIFKKQGVSYLVMVISKNRNLDAITKEYAIYKFDPIKGLPFDVHLENSEELGKMSQLQNSF